MSFVVLEIHVDRSSFIDNLFILLHYQNYHVFFFYTFLIVQAMCRQEPASQKIRVELSTNRVFHSSQK